jgi:hypothetical protein
MEKFVLNLSQQVLTTDQISVLSKGLNFCPTPQAPNPGDYKIDLDSLHRRLRLRARFHDEESDDFDPGMDVDPSDAFQNRKFRLKSSYNPTGPPALEAMILLNEHNFNNRPMFKAPREKNLTPGEFQALRELKTMNHIVLKKADKGSAVVVMDKDIYIAEAHRQLQNPNFYKKVENDLTEKHRSEVQTYIDKMYTDGELDISVVNYLYDHECRTAQLYLLPKIHKGINPPPGRPIVSANGCPTENISQLVDHFLNYPATQVKSYIRDTTDFLHKLEALGTLPANSILVTLDVTSLYTNIPNKEGLRAAREALFNSRPGTVNPTNDSLINLL